MAAAQAKARVREGLVAALAPVAARRYRERPALRVISLHDVLPGAGSPFPARMRWLARRYRVVPLADALARERLDPECLNVALSFDDAYAEHASFAAPILAELGLPATFFVPSGALGLAGEQAQRFASERIRRGSRRFAFMRAEDVAALAAEPLFEIGGHGSSHADLGALGDEAQLRAEIAADKHALEQLAAAPLRFFAYPFGGAEHTSARACAALAAAGYEAAFTIMPAYWSRRSPRYLLGRDSLGFDAPERAWADALAGGYDAIAWLKWRAAARRRPDPAREA